MQGNGVWVPFMPEQAIISLVICEVVMARCLEIMDFWYVVPCIFIDRLKCFRGACIPCYVMSRPRRIFFNLKTNWLF
jgi:hypothetical protein